MAVALMVEWDNAKDESRYKEYGRRSRSGEECPRGFFNKKVEEGIVKRWNGWSDNTGHLILLVEFEDIGDFAKLWADWEFHNGWLAWNPLVDNLRFRLLRGGVPVPEE